MLDTTRIALRTISSIWCSGQVSPTQRPRSKVTTCVSGMNRMNSRIRGDITSRGYGGPGKVDHGLQKHIAHDARQTHTRQDARQDHAKCEEAQAAQGEGGQHAQRIPLEPQAVDEFARHNQEGHTQQRHQELHHQLCAQDCRWTYRSGPKAAQNATLAIIGQRDGKRNEGADRDDHRGIRRHRDIHRSIAAVNGRGFIPEDAPQKDQDHQRQRKCKQRHDRKPEIELAFHDGEFPETSHPWPSHISRESRGRSIAGIRLRARLVPSGYR